MEQYYLGLSANCSPSHAPKIYIFLLLGNKHDRNMITYFPASPNAFFINIPIPKATASAFGYFLPLIRDDFYKNSIV